MVKPDVCGQENLILIHVGSYGNYNIAFLLSQETREYRTEALYKSHVRVAMLYQEIKVIFTSRFLRHKKVDPKTFCA
jgi:hypothetical protein